MYMRNHIRMCMSASTSIVCIHPDSGLYHVNYEEMIPLLLQSIKELHARVAVLEQRP